eukprot:scaffold1990_cov350-Prasinococcus_capsulatus_cf.AAC.4
MPRRASECLRGHAAGRCAFVRLRGEHPAPVRQWAGLAANMLAPTPPPTRAALTLRAPAPSPRPFTRRPHALDTRATIRSPQATADERLTSAGVQLPRRTICIYIGWAPPPARRRNSACRRDGADSGTLPCLAGG